MKGCAYVWWRSAAVAAGVLVACGGEEVSRTDLYLGPSLASALVMEVDHAPGTAPREVVMRDLEAGFTDLLDKPGGVTVETEESLTARGADYVWTEAALRDLAESSFDGPQENDVVRMHVLFVDGSLGREEEEDGDTLGLTLDNTHLVVFRQDIEEGCTSATEDPDLTELICTGVERFIWTHEVGHLLGLVDKGLPMVEDHEDPDHPRHDVNPDCVMFHAIARPGLANQINPGAAPPAHLGFDSECRADIESYQSALPASW